MKLNYVDRNHAYWLTVNGSKKRCKSVTTLAKIPDDDYHLTLWKMRQVAVGISRSPTIRESVAAHHTDKRKLDELVEKAMQAAGAGEAAERGTMTHRIAERADKGEDIIETESSVKIKANWENVLAQAQLTVVPELTERVVVYPDRLVCGKFDRILRRADGSLVIADIKSGQNAVAFPHSISIQLALYANAPYIAGELDDGLDGETEVFEELPGELDRSRGLIIHMPSIDEPATLHEINIAAGWKVVNNIVWPTLDWRARRNLTRPFAA